MTELDNISKSETPNLATLHRLACTRSYSSINSESLPKKLPILKMAAIGAIGQICDGPIAETLP